MSSSCNYDNLRNIDSDDSRLTSPEVVANYTFSNGGGGGGASHSSSSSFNSSTATNTSTTIGTGDLLRNLQLDFNGVSRVEPFVGTAQLLRVIQAMEFHTRVPDRLFYMYSFSLDPESESPCGSVNLSRIKNQNLYLALNPSPANVNIRIYVTSYNFMEGTKIVFSNFK
jgi:hypothetical protein